MDHSNSTWSFVDLFLLLCVAFLVVAQIQEKEAMDDGKFYPTINIFVEQTENTYKVRCNSTPEKRYVTFSQLAKIIKKSLQEDVEKVQVVAFVDSDIPFGFVAQVKNCILSAGVSGTRAEKKLNVLWDARVSHGIKKN